MKSPQFNSMDAERNTLRLFCTIQFFLFDLKMMHKYGFVQMTFKDTDFYQLKKYRNCEKILIPL